MIWHPDRIYTVDICKVDNDLQVLELNSFSCSNLYNISNSNIYGCNLRNIVEEANLIAIAEWKEAYE